MAYLAAAEVNKSIDFAGLRIYGLLTDLVQFTFYSYEPTTRQFCFDEILYVNLKRTDALSDMIGGMYFSPWQLLRADIFCLQCPIRYLVFFYQPIWKVYMQLLNIAKSLRGPSTMMLVEGIGRCIYQCFIYSKIVHFTFYINAPQQEAFRQVTIAKTAAANEGEWVADH
jgi:hypothetical protein